MKVRGWLLDKSCAVLLFMLRMLELRARVHLNNFRVDCKSCHLSKIPRRRSRNLDFRGRSTVCLRFFFVGCPPSRPSQHAE